MSQKKQATLRVAGRDVNLSNLDKVMYPEVGFTKGQVIDYWPVLNEKAIGDVRLEAIHVRYIRRCNCWKV